MKKFVKIAILWMLVFTMSGCSNKGQEGTPIDIFYLNNSDTAIRSEIHYIESETTKEQVVEVLSLMCSVPEHKELKAPIAGGLNIINYSIKDRKVTVSLGEKYHELSKTTEILVRAAIVKSLTQIEDIESVEITVAGEPLVDSKGNVVGPMAAEMFLDSEKDNMNNYEKVTIRLYFANEEGDKLIPIDRSLVHNIDLSNISMERLVIEQLLAGPVNAESYPAVNPETKLLSINVKDGVCYLNFDSQIVTPVNNVNSDVVIYAIVNSLVELNHIQKVQISIDGKKDIKFRDKYDLNELFERNLDIVQ